MTIGADGQRVARNIKTMREYDGLTFAALSRKLEEEVGRTIPPLGLRRIEKFERRVDADDLVAFSLVFEVNIEHLIQLTASAPPVADFQFAPTEETP